MKRYPAYEFDESRASHAEKFFDEYLRHSKGEWAGRPFILEDWQRSIIRDVYGWVHRETRVRQYTTAYLELPRKNGKSTLGAGNGLYLLTGDREPGAEVYSAAGEKEQARIVFAEASAMVGQSDVLKEMLEVQRNAIVFANKGSSYRVLSADADTKHGFNPSGIIFDELHVQPNRDLWDVLKTGTAARAQPLTWAFTTAGHDRNSICWEQHDYATKVIDGIIEDPNFYAVIFAADPGDDWRDPATWKKANPNFGISVKEDYLIGACRTAAETPAYENTFKRLHLNLWTEQETRWISVHTWDESNVPLCREWELAGRDCYVGLDLSQTTDITAAVRLFPRPDGSFDVFPRFYVPKENAEKRARKDRVPYPQWIREGWIVPTEGNVIDYEYIKADLMKWSKIYQIKEVAYDPWNATQIALQLQAEGVTVVPVRQGYATMSEPTKTFEKLVLSNKLRHGGNPVLRWMLSNVAIEIDPAGNIKPSKKKSTERIDGVVATINALSRATLPGAATGSIYARRGIISV